MNAHAKFRMVLFNVFDTLGLFWTFSEDQ